MNINSYRGSTVPTAVRINCSPSHALEVWSTANCSYGDYGTLAHDKHGLIAKRCLCSENGSTMMMTLRMTTTRMGMCAEQVYNTCRSKCFSCLLYPHKPFWGSDFWSFKPISWLVDLCYPRVTQVLLMAACVWLQDERMEDGGGMEQLATTKGPLQCLVWFHHNSSFL